MRDVQRVLHSRDGRHQGDPVRHRRDDDATVKLQKAPEVRMNMSAGGYEQPNGASRPSIERRGQSKGHEHEQ